MVRAPLVAAGIGAALAQPSLADAPRAWTAARDSALAAHGIAPPALADGPAAVAPAPALQGDPQVNTGDARLALTQLAIGGEVTAQDAILDAQSADGPGALYLRSGHADPDTLYDITRDTEAAPLLAREDGAVVARGPIVVLRGAALSVGPETPLVLDGTHGAFLLSFGELKLTGAALTALSGENGFRPFITSGGSGTLHIADSELSGLGFGTDPVTAGIAVRAGGLFRSDNPLRVTGSRLRDVGGVTVQGDHGVVIDGNIVDGARRTAFSLRDTDDVWITRNVLTDVQGHPALRLSGTITRATVADNWLSGGAGAGLRIDDGARGIAVRGNLIENFAGAGIELGERAGCVHAARNVLRGNGGAGLRAIRAGTLVAEENALIGNAAAGLSLSRALPDARALLVGNAFAGNRTGIETAALRHLRLSGGRFDAQRPRLLSGDAGQHVPRLLRSMRDGDRPDLALEHVTPRVSAPLAADAAPRAFAACRDQGGAG